MVEPVKIKRIAVGSDHYGYVLKETLKETLVEFGYEYLDLGTNDQERTDYPVYAARVTEAISQGQADLGILICGTGAGMSIAANKKKGIRAVCCSDIYTAVLSRQHNDANILALGSMVTGTGLAKMIVKAWLEAEFEGGRHARRLEMIADLEQTPTPEGEPQ